MDIHTDAWIRKTISTCRQRYTKDKGLTACYLGLGQESLDGQKLLAGNIDLVALLEAAGDHAVAHFY